MDLEIWFHLVDSKGNPYQGLTEVIGVKLPADSKFNDFKNAVKARNPNKLSSFDASEFKVYKSVQDFESKNSLSPRMMIKDLGNSISEETFLVEVPTFSGKTNLLFNQL